MCNETGSMCFALLLESGHAVAQVCAVKCCVGQSHWVRGDGVGALPHTHTTTHLHERGAARRYQTGYTL